MSALGCSLRSGDSNRGEFFADRIGCIIQQPAQKLGAAVEFITERLAFLAVFLDCPSVRKVPRQDSSTSPDRGWAVSLRRGDLLVSPAHAGCPDLFGMEEYVDSRPQRLLGSFPRSWIVTALRRGERESHGGTGQCRKKAQNGNGHMSKSLPGPPSGGE